ncbi:hypothetical protein NFG57_03700 [Halomonas sp. H10-59]|uniref:Uncharacterized protein n=1 Tax=Halomonas sp. H10-59 TaxID=2950874 RepID=A0AAU7KVX9_9GAMM
MNVRIKGLFYASVGGTQAPALHVEGGDASTLNTSKKPIGAAWGTPGDAGECTDASSA